MSYIQFNRVAERTKVWTLIWWFWLTRSRGALFKFFLWTYGVYQERPTVLRIKVSCVKLRRWYPKLNCECDNDGITFTEFQTTSIYMVHSNNDICIFRTLNICKQHVINIRGKQKHSLS
jgi:hypothetical protein